MFCVSHIKVSKTAFHWAPPQSMIYRHVAGSQLWGTPYSAQSINTHISEQPLNQSQTQGGLTDVLYWCVAAGGQPGGWDWFWIVWSINKNQSHCATVKVVYTVFTYMKGSTHNDFNPSARILNVWSWDFTQHVRCCAYYCFHVCHILVYTWCHNHLTHSLLYVTQCELNKQLSRKRKPRARCTMTLRFELHFI